MGVCIFTLCEFDSLHFFPADLESWCCKQQQFETLEEKSIQAVHCNPTELEDLQTVGIPQY